MTNLTQKIIIIFAWIVTFNLNLNAQSSYKSLKELMDATMYKYTVLERKDEDAYKIEIGLDSNRSQIIIVSAPKTFSNSDGDWLKISSPCFDIPLDSEKKYKLAYEYLWYNADDGWGSWEIVKVNTELIFNYSVKLPINTSLEEFTDQIAFVKSYTDRCEKKVMNQDKY